MNGNSNEQHIKAILFDYGGTIDTNGVHWSEIIYDGYSACNAAVPKDIFRKAYVYAEQYMEKNPTLVDANDTFKETLLKKIKIQSDYYAKEALPYNIAQQVGNIAEYCYQVAKTTIAEAEKTLAVLYKRYPLALVSNFYGNLQSVIKDFGIHQYFTTIVESSIVGVRKPDAELFRIALERLSISASEAMIVGDSYKNDMAPAIQLGCTSVWLKGVGWEQEENSANKMDVTRTINSFGCLPSIVEELEQ